MLLRRHARKSSYMRNGNIFITCMVIPVVEVVSIKVDKRVKDKMKKLSNVNWSETLRRALAAKIGEEEAKTRTVDPKSLVEAASLTDRIRKASRHWSSTEEIRRWRETRK